MFWRVIPSSVGKGRDSVTETWEDFPEGQGFTCKEVIQVRRNPRQAWGGRGGESRGPTDNVTKSDTAAGD